MRMKLWVLILLAMTAIAVGFTVGWFVKKPTVTVDKDTANDTTTVKVAS